MNCELTIFSPSDTVIAVMGITGVGKSTFINYFADKKAIVGNDLESCELNLTPKLCIGLQKEVVDAFDVTKAPGKSRFILVPSQMVPSYTLLTRQVSTTRTHQIQTSYAK